MNLTSRVSHPSTTARPRPAELLGPHHPLVRDLERLDIARSQSVMVAGTLAAGVGMLVTHAAAGFALTIAAVIVELLIAFRIAALRESRRLRVLDLIAEGHARLPIPIIEQTCVRLGAPRHRQRLARSLETLLDPRPGNFDAVVVPWQFAGSELVIAVRAELHDIAELLSQPDASLEGIALTARLLSDGSSSLHGDDPRMLHEELGRLRFLLEARACAMPTSGYRHVSIRRRGA